MREALREDLPILVNGLVTGLITWAIAHFDGLDFAVAYVAVLITIWGQVGARR